jgi:aminoglycoside/choline kinase family phosphotransferase
MAMRAERLERLHTWTAQQAGLVECRLELASGDASFRHYFRVIAGNKRFIVMDAPPDKEDCRPFIKVARLLRAAGLHAPEVFAQDLKQGFLLLTDLGTDTYLDVLTRERVAGNDLERPQTAPGGAREEFSASHADALFGDAIDALIRWQLASQPDVLPPYDEALLRRELNLFIQWYLPKHLGLNLNHASQRLWEETCAHLVKSALAQPQVYVHRDYMPRNLMVSQPNPGVLDFQDAVYGPLTYDVISLFKDAFISWPEERVEGWSRRYWEAARAAALPVQQTFVDFKRAFDWMGLQRHLKVLGIFARLTYCDGKPNYVADTPRFVRYIMTIAPRYPELAPLTHLFEQHVLPRVVL